MKIKTNVFLDIKIPNIVLQIEEQFDLSYDESTCLNLRFNKEILETNKAHNQVKTYHTKPNYTIASDQISDC